MDSIIITTKSEQETKDLGKKIADLVKNKTFALQVILLCGDLGTGKTIFSKGFLHSFDYQESEVTSPTFILIKRFKAQEINIYHIDLYRLNNPGEIEGIGIYDFLEESNAVSLVEWGEKLDYFPKATIKINFKWLDEDIREIEIVGEPDFLEKIKKSFNF